MANLFLSSNTVALLPTSDRTHVIYHYDLPIYDIMSDDFNEIKTLEKCNELCFPLIYKLLQFFGYSSCAYRECKTFYLHLKTRVRNTTKNR